MMKKVSVIAFFVCLMAAANTVQAQSVVKINILSPVVRTINLSYEVAISENGSFQLGFFYTGYKDDVTKFSGFGITPEYRFYLSETTAPEGFYVAPFLRYRRFTVENVETDSEGTYSPFGGGLIIGKQWIFKDKISLDLFLGPQYSSGDVKLSSGDEGDLDLGVFDGFGLRTGITLGIKF